MMGPSPTPRKARCLGVGGCDRIRRLIIPPADLWTATPLSSRRSPRGLPWGFVIAPRRLSIGCQYSRASRREFEQAFDKMGNRIETPAMEPAGSQTILRAANRRRILGL